MARRDGAGESDLGARDWCRRGFAKARFGLPSGACSTCSRCRCFASPGRAVDEPVLMDRFVGDLRIHGVITNRAHVAVGMQRKCV